jgi:hypothetical protein
MSLVAGIKLGNEFKKRGRPYYLLIQYQQYFSKAPAFQYKGSIEINEQVYPQDIFIEPRLGLLSLRLTFYMINKGVSH